MLIYPWGINYFEDKIKEERISNIRHKLSKSTDKMLYISGMSGYSSTMDFVLEFQKHYRMTKICDNEHIADCWPSKTVKISNFVNEENLDISTVKKSVNLRLPKGEFYDWDDTVGLISVDGISMILSYNKKCNKSATDGVIWSQDSSNSNTCIALAYDYNGGKKPNEFKKDVLLINAGGLGESCSFETTGGDCYITAQNVNPLSDTSKDYRLKLGLKYATSQIPDYYGGAAEMCGGVQNLPSLSDFEEFKNSLYQSNKQYDKDAGAAMGMPFPDYRNYVWTSSYDSNYGRVMVFGKSMNDSFTYNYRKRNSPNTFVLCKVN